MTAIPTPVLGEDGKLAIVTPTPQRRRKAVDGERSKPRVLITIIMGVIAVAWLFPLVGLLVTSVRDKADVDSSGWRTVFTNPFGQNWTLNNFSEAWESLNVSTSFWNSLAVTIPATVLPIMVAAMAAPAVVVVAVGFFISTGLGFLLLVAFGVLGAVGYSRLTRRR